MKKVSVVVPVYNTAGYIRRCLDSILAQNVAPYEMILVDDGSSDGSAEICDEYASRYPECVRVLHQENHGASAARNRGIELSTGDYLSFIDSDDYLDPNMYAHLLSIAGEYDAEMAVIEMWIEKEDGQRYCRVNKEIKCCWTTAEALVELNSYRYLHTSFCTMLIERKTMASFRFPEGQRCEDYALLYRVVAACKKVAYSSKPFYHYIQRMNSNSRSAEIHLEPMEISASQLHFFHAAFPEISYAAETDCVFAHIGVYTEYVRCGQMCPKELLKTLQKTARKYLTAVLHNQNIPTVKKFQALTFCLSSGIYKWIVSRMEHR